MMIVVKPKPVSRNFPSHHPYYTYDPYLYRKGLIPVLRRTFTIVPFGKDGKDRKHGLMQIFCIHLVISVPRLP
jgi:hypothetical protein